MFDKIWQTIGNNGERNRIALMGGILMGAALTTPWFHGILRNDAVFTHLFYVPIILASIWWRKKGLLAAFFLTAVLIISHIHNQIQGYNDYFRAAIFILVAYVVAELSKRISRSEKALRESEERYRNIFNNAQVGMFRSTIRDGTVLEANQRIADILGFESRKELMRTYKTSDYYVDSGQRNRILTEGRETGLFDEDGVAIRRKDGSISWVRISGRIYREEGYLEGVMIDITQQKLVEDRLRKSEEKYRNLFHNAQVGAVWTSPEDGRVVDANQRLAEIYGYSSIPELKNGLPVTEHYVDPGDRVKFLAEVEKCGHIENFEARHRRRDGDIIWVRYSGRLDCEEHLLESVVVDVTREKLAMAALRESEAKYRQFFDNAYVGMGRIRISDGRVLEANRRAAEIGGYDSVERLKEEYLFFGRYVDKGDREAFLSEVLSKGKIENFETRIIREDGEIIWVRQSGRVHPGKDYLEGIVVDVTAEKEARDALLEREENYRAVFNGVKDLIMIHDIETGEVLDLNDNVRSLFGYERDEIMGFEMEALSAGVPPYDMQHALNWIKKASEEEKPLIFEWLCKDKGGRNLWAEVSLTRTSVGGKDRVLAVTRDIDGRKRVERDLKRINRQLLEEGKKRRYLSGRLIDLLEKDRKRIAMDLHDQVGQDLTTLKIDLEMLLRKLGSKEAAWGGKINAARDKAVKAIKDIKEISSDLRPSVLDHLGLVPALKELCDDMNQQAIVHVDFFCPNKICDLDSAREVAIYRIIQEGLTNILKHSGAQKAFVTLIEKGGMITLSIEDDGDGIPKWNDNGLKFSKGMGLLIMEERTVHLGGSFHVDSSGGRGTTLLAEIPCKWGAPKNNGPDHLLCRNAL